MNRKYQIDPLLILAFVAVLLGGSRSVDGLSPTMVCRAFRVQGQYLFIAVRLPPSHGSGYPQVVPMGALEVWSTGEKEELLWSINAEEETSLVTIGYGVVPTGYIQKIPNSGRTPKPLTDGTYRLWCAGSGMMRINASEVTNIE